MCLTIEPSDQHLQLSLTFSSLFHENGGPCFLSLNLSFLFVDRVSLYKPGMPRIYDPPVLASARLSLQVGITEYSLEKSLFKTVVSMCCLLSHPLSTVRLEHPLKPEDSALTTWQTNGSLSDIYAKTWVAPVHSSTDSADK